MKLLIDPNLSFVRPLGLERADDGVLWEFARNGGYVIMSKDADFHQMSFALGHPPKVGWIKRGNCSTREIELTLRAAQGAIRQFVDDLDASFLIVE